MSDWDFIKKYAPLMTLAVDLDGTLLKSNMLLESFWSAFSRNWRSPFSAIAALFRGKAALKRHLATASQLDFATLPYDPDVIAFIKAWRQAGGKAVLVTASDQYFADKIGAHLGIFDDVQGSDGVLNLRGDQKAQHLADRFGDGKFAYMGDAGIDVAVWSRSGAAITVNADATLRNKARSVCQLVHHIGGAGASVKPYFKAMRPHQWLKNILVFLPMLAAHRLEGSVFLLSLLAFLSFSLIASSVYVLNDLLDLKADRAHPRKKNRPFAAGSIPIAYGTWMAGGLFLAGTGISLAISPLFGLTMLGYYVLTTAYSLTIKRQIVIDICVLAGLYTFRIIAGSVAAEINLSVWLLAFAVFFFLSLAAVKRQAELIDSAERGKLSPGGRGYHVDDLPVITMIAIGAGYVSVLVMVLYVNSPAVLELYPLPEALLGVCAVLLYWITRTVMLAHRGLMEDDPVVYAARDRLSQICLLLCLTFIIAGATI